MTPAFAYLGLIAALLSAAGSALQPVLPRYVKTELGQTDRWVGLAFGATAVGALLLRLIVTRWASGVSSKRLMTFGTALAGAVMLIQQHTHSVTALIPLRIAFGAGNAAAFLSVLALAMRFAEPARRGEAATLALITVHLGVGAGPLLGEWLLDQGSYGLVWLVSGLGMFAAAGLALGLRPPHEPSESDTYITNGRPEKPGRQPFVRRDAVFPGVVNAIGQLPFLGFMTFLPLYGKQIGLDNVALVLATVSATMVVVRVVGIRLPDRLGPRNGAMLALVFLCLGLAITAAWRDPIGLYCSAVVLGFGTALLFPCLIVGAVAGVPEAEKASALATFSMFQDLTIGLGGAFNGAVASAVGYQGLFVVGAGVSAFDIALIHVWDAKRQTRRTTSD